MSDFEGHPLHPGQGVPFFLAPGVVKDAPQLEVFMDQIDPLLAPVVVSGGWTLPEWPGNATSAHPTDFVYNADRQMAGNARGLPSSGIEGLRRLGPTIRRLADQGIKTIIQVTNLPFEKPIAVIPQLVEVAAQQDPIAVEINFSCPNGKRADGTLEAPTCDNPEVCAEVLDAVEVRIGNAVMVGAKDSPHASSLESGVNEFAVRGFIKAVQPYVGYVSGINTIGNQPFPELDCAGGRGGMSGPVVAALALEWLQVTRATLDPKIPILSCGGVDSGNVVEQTTLRLDSGALLVGGAQQAYRGRPERVMRDWAERWLAAQ